MALGVVGAVNEQAGDRGGQGFAANSAGLGKISGGEGADAREGGVESGVEFGEEGGFGGAGVAFGFERFELDGAELVAFGVGEQAVEGAGDVAEMKGDGGHVAGAGIEHGVGEWGAGSVDVLAGELEGMNDGAEDGGKVGVGAAEPGFHGIRVQGTAFRRTPLPPPLLRFPPNTLFGSKCRIRLRTLNDNYFATW